jgi:hypothetical protein
MNQEEQAKKMQKVIAKAWTDEGFKQKLISQPSETLRDEGMDVPQGVELRVVESTEKVVYLVLPPKPSSDEISHEQVEQRLAAGCGGKYCFCW